MKPLRPGEHVDRYVVEALIGEGGMATVYRVRHRTLESVYALKILTTTRPEVQGRLIAEGKAQARLAHPNVVEVRDVLDVDGAPGLLMDLVTGPSLDVLLARRGALPADEALAIFHGILDGVARAHACGVVHRDLKPSNVLLVSTPAGFHPKVADFGIAKIVSDATGDFRTASGIGMGTPGYMAPEQIEDAAAADARADIFALGCILYELVSGKGPFTRPTVSATLLATLSGEVPPLPAGTPGSICAAVAGSLQRDRSSRLGSCEAVRAVLEGRTPAPVRTIAGRVVQEPAVGPAPSRHRSEGTWMEAALEPVTRATPTLALPPEEPATPVPVRTEAAPAATTLSTFTRAVPGRSRWPLVVAGMVGFLGVGVTGWIVLQNLPEPESERQAGPAVPVDDPGVSAAALTPTGVEPVTSSGATDAAPVEKPASADIRPRSTVEPERRPVSEEAVRVGHLTPTPIETPPVAATADLGSAAEAALPEAPATSASVRLGAGVRRAVLKGSGGNFTLPADVPAGEYKVEATGDDGPANGMGKVRVDAGTAVRLECSFDFGSCKVVR